MGIDGQDYLSYLPEGILRYILEIASNGRAKLLLRYASVCSRFLQAVHRVPKLKVEVNQWETNVRDRLLKPVLRTTDLQSLTIICNSSKCIQRFDTLKLCLEHTQESLMEFLFDVIPSQEEGNVTGYSFDVLDFIMANCRRIKTLRLNPWMNVREREMNMLSCYQPLSSLENLVMGNAHFDDEEDGDLGPFLQLLPCLQSLTIEFHGLTKQFIVRSSSLKTFVIGPASNPKRDRFSPARAAVSTVIVEAPKLEHATLRHVSQFSFQEGTCPREIILDNCIKGLNLSTTTVLKPVDMAVLARWSDFPNGKSAFAGGVKFCPNGADVKDLANLLVAYRSSIRRLGIDVQADRETKPVEAQFFLDAFLHPFPTLKSLEMRGEIIRWLQDYVGEGCGQSGNQNRTRAFLQAPRLEELKMWVEHCSPRTVQVVQSFLESSVNLKTVTLMLYRFPVKCGPAWGFLMDWVKLEKEQTGEPGRTLVLVEKEEWGGGWKTVDTSQKITRRWDL